MKVDDRLLFPLFQPMIARNPTVVFVDLPVARLPVVELAGRDSQPFHEPADCNLGLLAPAPHEIDEPIPNIVSHPLLTQISPRLFFKITCSSISSAKTSFFFCIFSSSLSIRRCCL